MSASMPGGRAVVVVAALICATNAHAVESGDRYGAVVAARVDLQRQLAEWLTKSLAGPAEPYRVEAAVRLELRGVVREVRSKQHNSTPSVKIGGKSRVKLPGLGMVDGGGGQTNLVPEIDIDGGTRVSEVVSRQLETEVARMTVLLFVDPVMPEDRRKFLVRLAGDLAGIDRARGDDVVIEEKPPPPAGMQVPGGPILQATLQAPAKLPWEVIAVCATALGAAAILAFGLSRRGADRGLGAPGLRGTGEGRAAAPEGNGAAEVPAEERARRKRREELGAFEELADATPREIVQVIAEVDPHTASAVADLVGFDAESAKLVDELLPPQRRVELGIGLATRRVLTREQLAGMESAAAEALRRIRDRVPLGGPARLAGFLALAPPNIRSEVLEGVAARDRALAQAARQAVLLFEDLPRLSDASVRRVVTGIDPGTVALALVGSSEIRDIVFGAVSKRLRSILEVEEEALEDKAQPDVENARRTLEDAMRQLHERGDLRSRAA